MKEERWYFITEGKLSIPILQLFCPAAPRDSGVTEGGGADGGGVTEGGGADGGGVTEGGGADGGGGSVSVTAIKLMAESVWLSISLLWECLQK